MWIMFLHNGSRTIVNVNNVNAIHYNDKWKTFSLTMNGASEDSYQIEGDYAKAVYDKFDQLITWRDVVYVAEHDELKTD